MRVLCVYATRQIDSNLFMSSTIFRGLQEAGYEADMYFVGIDRVIEEFKVNYSHYFNKVFYCEIKESWLKRKCDEKAITKLAYSYYRHFIADGFRSFKDETLHLQKDYDCILSFIPPILSGRIAIQIKKRFFSNNIKLIQFWTDPLSLGRCDSYKDMPKSRIVHKWQERRLLKQADKVVFCYPLLCENEQKLHPQYASKMFWSDVSYMMHQETPKQPHQKPLIGLFGAYQKHVRNIGPLLEAIKELPQYNFILRGDGDLPDGFIKPNNLDLEQGRKPLEEIESLENECDVLLSLGGLSGLTHPAGKTFYYASYNKPIIHISDGKNGKYFEEYLRGFEGRFVHCFNEKENIKMCLKNTLNELPTFSLRIPTRMDASFITNKILKSN